MTTLLREPIAALTERVACSHCGLPVPASLLEPAAKDQFCCAGCRTVYSVIHSCRLDQYYDYLRRDREAGGASAPAKITGKAYREFDDPTFQNLHAPPNPATSARTIDFYLENVHCAACVWLVEKIPALLPGIVESRLSLGKQLLQVTFLDRRVNLSAIARLLDSLGYPPHPARSTTARNIRTADDRRALIRIGVAGACAGNTMLLAIALYAGHASSMDPAYLLLFRYLSMIIGVIALAWPGSTFFRGASAALRTRTPHLDLPIALALAVGGVAGLISTLSNRGDIYFDSLSVLVFLLLVGRFLQRRRQALAEDAVELLFSLTPASARRITGDSIEEVPIAALQIEDIVEVLPGESLPVDGQLAGDFSTTVDESLLTGESRPRSKNHSDALLFAGTVNLTSPIRVRVLAAGEATRVGKLMRLVADCASRRAPLVILADRIAGWFLAAVLLIAVSAFTYWCLAAGAAVAINHAVAILIVACPCALGMATPLAVTVAIGRAAKRGILIKGGDTLERLAKPGLLLLDKTGTLTTGKMSLQYWHGDQETRDAVAAIEVHATHPIARALADDAMPLQASDIHQHTHGISGTVNSIRYHIGTRRFIESQAISIPFAWQNHLDRCTSTGLSPVLIAAGDQLVSIAGIGDTLRPDAAAALDILRTHGWQLAILSGDHPDVVSRIAGQLNITDARGALLPEQKLARVRELMSDPARARRPVVMVGDGINDAAALAAASVGIAVHGGAEASLAAAAIYLTTPGLSGVAHTIVAAKRTVRAIHRCLAASIAYNALFVTLAACGWVNPLVAAIFMPVSSLTVISLAFTARTFKKGAAT